MPLWPAYVASKAAVLGPEDAVMQAYFMLDEMLIAGELQEPSKKVHFITAASQGVLVLKSIQLVCTGRCCTCCLVGVTPRWPERLCVLFKL